MDNSRRRVLVVDDVSTNRKLLQNILDKKGYRTSIAENGYDCIRAVLEQRPDLILLDIKMPDINGIEVCRKLRRDPRVGPIPILFVTGDTDAHTLSQAFDAGGNDYIRKPVNNVELLKRVQATFEYIDLIEAKKREDQLKNILSMNGTVCHELNQPMQYISGMSQLLLMDLEKSSPVYDKVAKIKSQIDRMDKIIKNLTRLNSLDSQNYLGDASDASLFTLAK